MTNVESILAGLADLPVLEDVQLLIVPQVPDVEMSAEEILATLGDWETAVSGRLAVQNLGSSALGRLWELQPMPLPGIVVGL